MKIPTSVVPSLSAYAILLAFGLPSTNAKRSANEGHLAEDTGYWDRFLAATAGSIPVAKPTAPPSPVAPDLCGDCWCQPSDGKGGSCPSFNLQAKYGRPTIAKYLSLGLPTNYNDSPSQELCYPNLDHLNLPPYSVPIPFLPNEGIGLTLCDDVMGRESSSPEAVCGFEFLDGSIPHPTFPCSLYGSINADNIASPSIGTLQEESNDIDLDDISTQSHPTNPVPNAYRMVTYPSRNKAIQERAFISHNGACGYCSSAQDLGVYLNDQIDLYNISFQCYFQWATSTDGNRNDQLIECMKQQSGITTNCAIAWATNMYFTSLPNPPFAFSCLDTCLPLLTNPVPPNKEEDCNLNDCLQCDEDVSGPVFVALAGRTRRNSGIVSTNIARPCDDIAEIRHDLSCNLMETEGL